MLHSIVNQLVTDEGRRGRLRSIIAFTFIMLGSVAGAPDRQSTRSYHLLLLSTVSVRWESWSMLAAIFFKYIKPLKVARTDVDPITLKEVRQLIEHVRPK